MMATGVAGISVIKQCSHMMSCFMTSCLSNRHSDSSQRHLPRISVLEKPESGDSKRYHNVPTVCTAKDKNVI